MRILILLLLAATSLLATEIAKDSCGVIVELREKYGPTIVDTGTVLMVYDNNFVLTKFNQPAAWYPVANYAVTKTRRLECVK
jgi:hypothetical protein